MVAYSNQSQQTRNQILAAATAEKKPGFRIETRRYAELQAHNTDKTVVQEEVSWRLIIVVDNLSEDAFTNCYVRSNCSVIS